MTAFTALLLFITVMGNGCATYPDQNAPAGVLPPTVPESSQLETTASMETEAEIVPSTDRESRQVISEIRDALVAGREITPERAIDLIALEPDSSYGRFLAGWIFFANGDTENAGKQFIRSLKLDPGNHHTLSALGNIAVQAGDLGKADTYYSKAHDAAGTPESTSPGGSDSTPGRRAGFPARARSRRTPNP